MRVVRSAGQNVSPSDDGRLFDQIFTDGLFTDASITNLGANNVALSALYGTICGRDFTAEAQNIVVTLPEGDGEYTGYIYVEIDTSSDDVITINSALAPFTPTYEDINTNGAVVQMILAEYTATALAIQSITPVYKIASAGGIGSLAIIETSPARTNHSKNTFLVYDGTLYKVTAAIASGEDLVIGTNISATTAGAEIVSLNKGLTQLRNHSTNSITASTVANTSVTVGSIHIPAGTWLVLVIADFQLPANGTYALALGYTTIRNTEINGGGAVVYGVFGGECDVNLMAYTSINNTIRISYTLIRLA